LDVGSFRHSGLGFSIKPNGGAAWPL